MDKALTILSVLGSVSSLVGLIVLFTGARGTKVKYVLFTAFSVCLLLTAYVLLVPTNPLSTNVAGKLRIYDLTKDSFGDHILVAQEGEETIYGPGPLSIKFPVPFKQPPNVELVNFVGYPEDHFPKIVEITRFQCVVRRERAHVFSDDQSKWYPDKFRWIATGLIMEQVNQ